MLPDWQTLEPAWISCVGVCTCLGGTGTRRGLAPGVAGRRGRCQRRPTRRDEHVQGRVSRPLAGQEGRRRSTKRGFATAGEPPLGRRKNSVPINGQPKDAPQMTVAAPNFRARNVAIKATEAAGGPHQQEEPSARAVIKADDPPTSWPSHPITRYSKLKSIIPRRTLPPSERYFESLVAPL